MSAADVLRKAAAVLEDRSATHGVPEKTFSDLSALWSEWLRMRNDPTILTPRDCAIMMILLKLVREANCLNTQKEHQDNLIDVINYAAIGNIL